MKREDVPAEFLSVLVGPFGLIDGLISEEGAQTILMALLPKIESMVRASILHAAWPDGDTSKVPEQVAESLGERLYDDAHEGCEEGGCHGTPRNVYDDMAREHLAAVLPLYDQLKAAASVSSTEETAR